MALFLPFRALGYICNDVPPAVQRRGVETYITVSVGKAWQVYNASTLRLVLVGPQLRHSIGALACKGDVTFAAIRGTIVECKRVHRSGQYRGHTADIVQLSVLGDLLLSLGKDGRLLVWRIGSYDAPLTDIRFSQGFVPTCMTHPDTYLNKVVVGSDDGRLQLWNFSSGRIIHEFASFGSAVRCISPSPALDVVGVGLNDGRAVIHNLRYDETITQFTNAAGAGTNADLFLTGSAAQAARLAAGAACTSLAFRTGAGIPLMAAGGGAGVITLWNLDERKLHSTIRDAHDAPVTALHFFAGEPVLLSSGVDNALKEWILDGPDGTARLLRFRSGHSAPPTRVKHYGPEGRWILSAGQDRAFRCFSTIQDAQSRELSQRNTKRRAKRLKISEEEVKLARIVALDACDVRERDWSNVLTAHHGDVNAYVWRLKQYALGEHVLSPPPKEVLDEPPLAPVTSVALSRCGNFGFVGSASGRLDRYNMQSGLHRGKYARIKQQQEQSPNDSTNHPVAAAAAAAAAALRLHAHDGAISGLAVDACNRYVASAGLDGVLRVWAFATRKLEGEVLLGCAIAALAHHPTTGLMAAACDDLVIRVVDVESRKQVRRFAGHTDRITDMQLSEDCRWLLSSSMDNTVRVWDVPGAQVLQVLRLGAPVTSLSLSPSQDLLATTHVERHGVYLWANQLIFGTGADVVPSATPVNARLPTTAGGFGSGRRSSPADDGEHGESNKRRKADVKAMLKYSYREGGGVNPEETVLPSFEEMSDVEASSEDVFVDSGSDSEFDDEDNEKGVDLEDTKADGAAAGFNVPGFDLSVGARYAAKDGAGAPVPLLPHLATLSMLPRTQWLNLVHLETIKARNKPLEAPQKPQAAPFFLPTLAEANAGRDPVFDTSAGLLPTDNSVDGATAAAAAAAWGGGSGGGTESSDEGDGNGRAHEAEENSNGGGENAFEQSEAQEADNGGIGGGIAPQKRFARDGSSRVLVRKDRSIKPSLHRSRVVQLLRDCSDAGDWTSLLAHLRSLTPSQIDAQLRGMQLLPGCEPEEEKNVELLFQFLEAEVASNANFEFVQALLRATLAVHADASVSRPGLRDAAARLERRVNASWKRLGDKLAHARCVVGLLGSLQG